MFLPDVLDVGVTMTLVSSPLLLRVCIVWVHIRVTRDSSIGGAEEGRERGREGGGKGRVSTKNSKSSQNKCRFGW